jgi:hypothetical protein
MRLIDNVLVTVAKSPASGSNLSRATGRNCSGGPGVNGTYESVLDRLRVIPARVYEGPDEPLMFVDDSERDTTANRRLPSGCVCIGRYGYCRYKVRTCISVQRIEGGKADATATTSATKPQSPRTRMGRQGQPAI